MTYADEVIRRLSTCVAEISSTPTDILSTQNYYCLPPYLVLQIVPSAWLADRLKHTRAMVNRNAPPNTRDYREARQLVHKVASDLRVDFSSFWTPVALFHLADATDVLDVRPSFEGAIIGFSIWLRSFRDHPQHRLAIVNHDLDNLPDVPLPGDAILNFEVLTTLEVVEHELRESAYNTQIELEKTLVRSRRSVIIQAN